MSDSEKQWQCATVRVSDGVAWLSLDRASKRNAINPQMNRDMIAALDWIEMDPASGAVVLSGNGGNFCSGMDIREYFRETDGLPTIARDRAYRQASEWMWRRLRTFSKPTIAMVEGYCLGGGLVPMIACDLAIASSTATFAASEINWGIIPAGNVAKALSTVLNARDALYWVMTGESFSGARAHELGLVNTVVDPSDLPKATEDLARVLLKKNPEVLRQAKCSFKLASELGWEAADEYLRAKQDQTTLLDKSRGRGVAMAKFLDEKSFRPGLQDYQDTPSAGEGA